MVGTLILLRHSKSAWPQDIPDAQRPLAARGRNDAPAVGRWLRQQAFAIDLVVCSPALRTRQTWRLAAAQLDAEPPVRFDDRLYGTCAEVFLRVVQELPDSTSTVALVGHNPSLEDLLPLLTGAGKPFKTSTLAVVTTPRVWAQAEPGRWTLHALATPRG